MWRSRIAAVAVGALVTTGCAAYGEPAEDEMQGEGASSERTDGADEEETGPNGVIANAALVESVAEEMRALDPEEIAADDLSLYPELNVNELGSADEEPVLVDKAVIGHDDIAPLRNGANAIFLKWQPRLTVEGGCVPFPAVDQWGNTSGGLENTGSENGGCGGNEGQIYGRAKCYSSGVCGLMYSWYFPKDGGVGGHRHDWEEVVIWVKGDTFLAAAYSGHGDYQLQKAGQDNNFYGGTHLKVKYKRTGFLGIFNHSLMPTGHNGGTQPLVQWGWMPTAARNAINNTSFGKASAKIKDSAFDGKINQARFW